MPRRHLLSLAALVLLTAAAAAATIAQQTAEGFDPPAGGAPAAERHGGASARTAAIGPTHTYRSPSGETVRIAVSRVYGNAGEVVRGWGAFMVGLVHGRELRTVTVYVSPPDRVRRACSGGVACYDPDTRIIRVPGNPPMDGQPVADVVAHEYGHHIAASRSNPPWDAYEWGTKRWASYEGICQGVRAGRLFPGAEGSRYSHNPGEAFAEAYRVLNGGGWSGVVDDSLAPDATSLALLREDVLRPWRGPRSILRRGTGPGRVRIATPLDGTLRAAAPGRRIFLRSAGRGQVLGQGFGRARATVCGQEAVVADVGGAGRFTLRVTRP